MNILVIGGYGNFGKRLVFSLLEHYSHVLTVAGRSELKAAQFCNAVEKKYKKHIDFLILDALTLELAPILRQLKVDVVVNAAGPYQDQMNTGANNTVKGELYNVATACIDAKCHYIDFADARPYVTGFINTLNERAKKAGVMLVTGASTVPGLTAAVIDAYLPRFSKLTKIHYGISPGNRTERGEGTIGSILSYTGKPFITLKDGRGQTVYGWQGLSLYDFGQPLGRRWMSHCDIPDLSLLPTRYPSLKSICFKAGLEVTILHCGLWLLSGLSRYGIVKNWSKYTRVITKLSEWFIGLGSDSGGMFVHLSGYDKQAKFIKVKWHLIAENGVGPNIPAIPAELVIKQLDEGNIEFGAMACMGLFSLSEFFTVASRWGIYQKEI